METTITLNISCNRTIDKQKIYDLFQTIFKYKEPLKFKAKHYAKGNDYKFNEKKYIKAFTDEMSITDDDIRLHLDLDGGFAAVICYRSNVAIRIHITLDDLGPALYQELENFIIENAIIASLANAHDMYIQNQRFIHMLEWAGENPRKYPKCKGILEEVEIDIAKNPGYEVYARGLVFAAFYRMWFGKEAYELFNKEELRSFKCYENRVLDNDVTRITLYENMLDYKKRRNRRMQRKFRKHVHLDEISDRIKKEEIEERKKNADPEINIKQGTFEHGGVRIIQTFLKDGENVKRSEADSVEEVELDESGKEVYSYKSPESIKNHCRY